jgi:hypothetical protein
MKIWKASLVLFYNDNDKYQIKFDFQELEDDYEINRYNQNEWVHSEGWINDSISKNKVARQNYSGYVIEQGFDYELTKEEQKQVENKMKIFMTKLIKRNKEIYLKEYEEKINVIQNN